jgi:CBS domain containing-hemolysin-like protein
LFSALGRLPRVGEQVKQDGLLFTVEFITGRRIRRVRALRTPSALLETEKENNVKE